MSTSTDSAACQRPAVFRPSAWPVHRRRPCAAQSDNRLTVWDPATGQAIATTADASPADVDRAVMSAWRAFCRSPLGRAHPG
ncbi:hypothetical protein LNQ03_00225 [Klebsiella pneumoniae subsp. pneumoniae]|nr:hypothetical protein [Klebsiella pneumoniae subsp. pneumoniae]